MPHGVSVLHDLRVPGSRANIDHLCVGPGGVTVVDSKNYAGKVRKRSGGLWVNGRNRTRLIEAVLSADRCRARGPRFELAPHDRRLRCPLLASMAGKLPWMFKISIDGVAVDRSGPSRSSRDVLLIPARRLNRPSSAASCWRISAGQRRRVRIRPAAPTTVGEAHQERHTVLEWRGERIQWLPDAPAS